MLRRLTTLLILFLFTSIVKASIDRPLISAAEPDYPPFSMVNDEGQAIGFSIDLLNAVTQAMKSEIHIKVAPWAEIKQELSDDKLDVLPFVARSPEREPYFDFTIPYLTLHGTIVVRKNTNNIQELSDLSESVIGVMKGDVAEEYLIRKKLTANLKTFSTYEIALKQLNSGLVDAVVVQNLVALQLIQKLNLNNLETHGRLKDFRVDFGFAVTEGDKQLLADLNEGLSIVIANGLYAEIRQKWLGILEPDETETYIYIVSSTTLVVMFLSLVFARLWQSSLRRKINESTAELEHYKNDLEDLVSTRTNELEEEKYKLDQAQEITHIGSYKWQLENNRTIWSDELFRIVGFNPQEFEPTYDKYLSCIQHDDREIFKQLTHNAFNSPLDYEGEYRIVRPDGEIRNVFERGEVEHDSKGNLLSLVGVIQDITERKTAEIKTKRIQQELFQSQKMESLGLLTGGIAHDFNNLLGVINGFAELTLLKLLDQKNDQLAEYVKNIHSAGERATALISQMLLFSRGDQAEDIPIDFSSLVTDELKLIRSTLPSSIEIKTHIDINLPKVLMNPTQLNQILMNLSINARDSMDGVGELTIRLTYLQDVDSEATISHKPVQGDWIELSISDTGPGIDPDIAKNIFHPFFTTKEVGKGSGMGLSVIYRIMENHNGHILLESEPGKGATFRLLFSPLVGGESNLPDSNDKISEIPLGDGLEILVVDDELMLAMHISELLKEYGYKTSMVTDSTEALEIFRQDPERYSLLVTDQTMPKMTGIELISKLRKIRPEFPAIMCSGYNEKIDSMNAGGLNIDYFDKPVDIKKLLYKISELTR